MHLPDHPAHALSAALTTADHYRNAATLADVARNNAAPEAAQFYQHRAARLRRETKLLARSHTHRDLTAGELNYVLRGAT